MSADQTVEVLYESGADYPGLLGMWSLPPWPDADFHSLLVLSFASSSRAMATGDTYASVTEQHGNVHASVTISGWSDQHMWSLLPWPDADFHSLLVLS